MTDHDDTDLPIDAWTLESLLDGGRPTDPAAPGVSELAALVSAARRPGTADEHSGEAAARAAFVAAAVGSASPSGRTRRSSVISTLLGSKLALAAAAAAVTLGGASAAAFTGSLPTPAQDAAHHLLGAPAADSDGAQSEDEQDSADAQDEPTTEPTSATDEPTATATSTPVGPDATGAAAYGLCTAWTAQVRAGHTPSPDSVAFRNLVTAAGGQDQVAAYCATVVATSHPSHPSHPTGSPTSHPNGSSSSHPTHPTHPTGSPTSHPTGSPTSHRAHPTGSPTTHPGGR